ncbi:MAG: hypothetical protein ACTHMX_05710, partial [Thermomicrobiales bacterium]
QVEEAGSTPALHGSSDVAMGFKSPRGTSFIAPPGPPSRTPLESYPEPTPRVPMRPTARPSRGALIRDLLIFHLKLWLDGFKDIVLLPLTLVAGGIDFIFRTRLFYRVLGLGERFDLWLNLFGAAQQAGHARDGLFGVSRAGDSTLLGQLEKLHGGEFKSATKAEPPRMRR